MSTLLLYFMATTSKTLTSSTLVKERWSEIFLHFYKGAGAAAQQGLPDRLEGGNQHQTPSGNPDGTTLLDAQHRSPAPASGKALDHICCNRVRERQFHFFAVVKRKVGGVGERGQERFCGSHTRSFLFEAKSGL